MDNFKFFGNGERPYILWSANDHEIPDENINFPHIADIIKWQ
jgi:hypothetical protein